MSLVFFRPFFCLADNAPRLNVAYRKELNGCSAKFQNGDFFYFEVKYFSHSHGFWN